jgi:tetratricopeptide (TPR) repeat protein
MNWLISLVLLWTLCGCSYFFSVDEPVTKAILDVPPVIKEKIPDKTMIKKKRDESHSKARSFVLKGDTFLFEGNVHKAYRQYSNALTIDPNNIPAIMGQAKCFIIDQKYDLAFASLSQIDDQAKRTRYAPEFSFLLIQSSISQTRLDNTGLIKIENAYYQAFPAYRNNPELYYYMGLACQKFFQYNRAKTFFSKVISLKSQLTENAYEQISKIMELEQCKSCEFREKIPLIPQLSRAHMAYLLHYELNIHEFLARFSNYQQKPHPQTARDIDSHSLKDEIQSILPLNLSGLCLFSDHQFQAEMPVTRGDFARIIYDIIHRIVPQLASTHSKKTVVIADIRKNQPFYRSVIFCTEHNIMLPLATGDFNPYGPVSGADAILSIRTLKHFIDQLAIGQ